MVKLFTQAEAQPYINEVAQLRLNIFKTFPYLYEGDAESERIYLQKFINTPDSMICLAFEGDKVVGAFTGLPLKYEEEAIRQSWENTEHDIDKIFYISEMLAYPEARGKGYGKEFFKVGEEWIKTLGKYDLLSFVTVDRAEDHPLKPKDYKPLDSFWQKYGYTKKEGLKCVMSWKGIGEKEASEHTLSFWEKSI